MGLEAYAHRVAQLVNDGKAFTFIEKSIETWPLSDEQRGTLWLYAWSLQSAARRRRHRAPSPEVSGD